MGTMYGLYKPDTKEWMQLGKRRGITEDGKGTEFDTPAETIVAFLSHSCRDSSKVVFEIFPDTINVPDEEDGWTEVTGGTVNG